MSLEIWHGAHNIFGVSLENELSSQKVKEICRGKNLDGIIVLHILNESEIQMKFFNPDGSKDNCGNGLRVAAYIAHTKGLVRSSGIIHSLEHIFSYHVKEKEVTIAFPLAHKQGKTWNIGGVIHNVVQVDSIEKSKRKAQELRNHSNTNITLVKKLHKAVFAQTFEQGVERFTASCGTGAIAAALETGVSNVFMPGGLLKVEQTPSTILLTGAVERVQ